KRLLERTRDAPMAHRSGLVRDLPVDRVLDQMVRERIRVAAAPPGFFDDPPVDELAQTVEDVVLGPAAHVADEIDVEALADDRRDLRDRARVVVETLDAQSDPLPSRLRQRGACRRTAVLAHTL